MVVHFDIDVVDGRELPLANFPHYCTGVSVETIRTVLRTLLESDHVAAIVLTEVNPTHDPSGLLLERYADLVVDVVGGAAALR